MRIFVPRLAPTTTAGELRQLAERVLAKRLRLPFTQPPEVRSCKILKITDAAGVTDFHGLLLVLPDSAGKWLIGNLKQQRLHNRPVLAREYQDRSRLRAKQVPEDRRRRNLEISQVEQPKVVVEGQRQFAVEHK